MNGRTLKDPLDLRTGDESASQLKKDIAEWQERADKTDYDDEGGTKYDEIALKNLVDEARTLLLRASLDLEAPEHTHNFVLHRSRNEMEKDLLVCPCGEHKYV